tara:strand:+ start:965 stop:1390 length:426 start_codon:yes stop_codon:yes gene_type:complete
MNTTTKKIYIEWRSDLSNAIKQIHISLDESKKLDGDSTLISLYCSALSHIFNKNKKESLRLFSVFKNKSNELIDELIDGKGNCFEIGYINAKSKNHTIINGESEKLRKTGELILKCINDVKYQLHIAMLMDMKYSYWKINI